MYVVALPLLLAAALSAQSPARSLSDPGTGVIRGRVVHAGTGQPLDRARIRTNTASLVTDEAGRFELSGLAAGRYLLTVSRSGFAARQRYVDVSAGQVVDRVELPLAPGAVITGTVLDRFGEPLVRGRVTLLAERYDDGERLLEPVRPVDQPVVGSGATDLTDDLGQFRLFGLQPGTYYVAAGLAASESFSRTPGTGNLQTLYPGSPSLAGAQRLTVGPGDEVAGLSFALVPVDVAAIHGTIRAPDGSPGRYTLTLARHDEVAGPQFRTVRTEPGGTFSATALPPGRYTLLARDGDHAALARVDLSGVDVSLTIEMHRGGTVRGRIVFDSGSPPPTLSPSSVTVRLRSTEVTSVLALANVADDWTFEATGLIGSQRLLPGVTGWTLKSVRWNGRDVTDSAIEIDRSDVNGIELLFTQQVTVLTGFVRDDRGQPVADARIVIFPEDPARWPATRRYIRQLASDEAGGFTTRALPPGRYHAIALPVDSIASGDETRPDVLERLTRAGTRVTLGEGETRSLDLRVVPAP